MYTIPQKPSAVFRGLLRASWGFMDHRTPHLVNVIRSENCCLSLTPPCTWCRIRWTAKKTWKIKQIKCIEKCPHDHFSSYFYSWNVHYWIQSHTWHGQQVTNYILTCVWVQLVTELEWEQYSRRDTGNKTVTEWLLFATLSNSLVLSDTEMLLSIIYVYCLPNCCGISFENKWRQQLKIYLVSLSIGVLLRIVFSFWIILGNKLEGERVEWLAFFVDCDNLTLTTIRMASCVKYNTIHPHNFFFFGLILERNVRIQSFGLRAGTVTNCIIKRVGGSDKNCFYMTSNEMDYSTFFNDAFVVISCSKRGLVVIYEF